VPIPKSTELVTINYLDGIMRLRFFAFVVLFINLVLLMGCATTGEDSLADEDLDKTAANIYREAKSALDKGDYETAIQRLETLEARFPFGDYAQQAQLDIAYAYFKYDEPESAVAAANRFIKLYPRHDNVDYAYYLKGLIRFNQGHSVFDKLASQDPAQRDPLTVRQSFQYFNELVTRFPASRYVEDSRERMIYLRNNLARYELYIARYYLNIGAYVAAANRGKKIIESFQLTPSVPEALVIMVLAYRKLGLNDLAMDSKAVLELNFPTHEVLAEL